MNGFVGLLLRRARLERGWSQEGLCKGVCAVSYLSKIEQGKVQPSDEVTKLLLGRLEIPWNTGEIAEKAAKLAEDMFSAFCAMDNQRGETLCAQLEQNDDYVNTPSMMDLLLLRGMYRKEGWQEMDAFAAVMDERQKCLRCLLKDDYEQAYQLLPLPITCALAGYHDYTCGNYVRAQMRLERAFGQAAEQCLPHLMLFCKAFLGNCCSDLNQYELMLQHYEGALRLAEAVGNQEMLRDIRYNIAATQMQHFRYEEAYGYYAALEEPAAMDLHKLAICCEAMGKREEALAALERAATVSTRYQVLGRKAADQMCAVVRYRLEHEDYLRQEAYGKLLLDCFELLRRELPRGYARFHLPWVEEWYVAHRQYKQALELRKEFS